MKKESVEKMDETIWVIYDNMVRKSEVIEDVIGNKGFADVVVKKKRLEIYYLENLKKIFGNFRFSTINSRYDLDNLCDELSVRKEDKIRVIHCFSNFIFSDIGKASLAFEKVKYIERTYEIVCNKTRVAIMYCCIDDYLTFIKQIFKANEQKSIAEADIKISNWFEIEGMTDIGKVNNFIQCITGNFDARYFNSLQGDDYVIVKKSQNIKKIKMEYQFYQLLPEDMKYWFVMPFGYQEENNEASYRMERLHMTDVAVKWVHGSFSESEFEELMDKFFYFFNHRHKKEVTSSEYKFISDSLYVNKVKKRIDKLLEMPEYISISKLLEATDINVENLYMRYYSLKEKIESRSRFVYVSVIGHGDPCFSNALYNKSTRTLKFIDPRGALIDEEMWIDPYYDIAKLSHSICGLYDFFNNALFEIKLNEKFEYELEFDFDNSMFKRIFRNKLTENGFDYELTRLYEVSLFLSMLPLHIDYPYKVMGFILNAKNILEELEQNV